ncbi:MAG: sigma-70 family RNA polymerase sigma factor [Rubrivivax sp.]
MISMHGVPSSLIAKNESWVRKQAQALARNLPSNVERADLIQVGLIAVAQASLGFEWEGDRNTPEATEAFVRYARARVKGAMLDELRQMDHLGRSQRRKIKVLQIARERFRSANGHDPTLGQLAQICGLGIDEIARLEQADMEGRTRSSSPNSEFGEFGEMPQSQAATPADEVEARVDTGIVLRRLESFFATLPERDRMVIDAYLGVGLSPVQVAATLNVTPSRVSQMFKASVQRIANHFGHDGQRATDLVVAGQALAEGRAQRARQSAADEAQSIARREAELAASAEHGGWGRMVEAVLTQPGELFDERPVDEPVRVDSSTRWG